MSGGYENKAETARVEAEKAASRRGSATVLCPECGTLIEVKDVQAVLLALHLQNDCDLSSLLVHRETV